MRYCQSKIHNRRVPSRVADAIWAFFGAYLAIFYLTTQAAGQIISADNSGILVSCGEQSLLLTVIQLPGKSRMPVSEILKSRAELFTAQTLLGN